MSIIPKSHNRIILILLYGTLLALFSYFVLPRIMVLFLPFIFGLVIATIVKPVVTVAENKLKMPRSLTSALMVLSTVLILFITIFLLVSQITAEINRIIKDFPQYSDLFKVFVDRFLQSNLGSWLPVYSKQTLLNFSNDLGASIVAIIPTQTTFDFAKGIFSSLPGILVFTIAMLVSAYFISSDSHLFYQWLTRIFRQGLIEKGRSLKNSLFVALGGYLKAQLTLISITFCHMFIWFLFIRPEYALTIAFVIAIVDALPFLGTSAVLVPWALVSFIQGDYRLGTILFLISGINMFVRQLLEPKLVSIHIGLHPLVTLMSMYVGLQIYGIVGIIIGPVIMLVIKNLSSMGAFDNFLYGVENK